MVEHEKEVVPVVADGQLHQRQRNTIDGGRSRSAFSVVVTVYRSAGASAATAAGSSQAKSPTSDTATAATMHPPTNPTRT